MAKINKQQKDRGRFGKCQICLGHIPIEYYFGIGDEISCYECGTVYFIESKEPVQLKMSEDRYIEDDDSSEMIFEDN